MFSLDGAAPVAYVAASSIWLFVIPILAISILRDGRQIVETIIEATKSRANATRVERILRHIDKMVAKYIRAQVFLSSFIAFPCSSWAFLMRLHSDFLGELSTPISRSWN